MEVVYITVGVSVVVALLFLFLFLKSVKSGQFEDPYSSSVRMLFEDEIVSAKKEENESVRKT